MSQNFYDGYIRKNPRTNAKCNPILFRDNYKPYFKSNLNYNLTNDNLCGVEHFTNLNENRNIQIVNNNKIPLPGNKNNIVVEKNSNDKDNHAYLKNVSCNGKQAVIEFNNTKKIYDISPKSLMKKKVLGDVKEIDAIHNGRLKQEVNYNDMKLQHLKNTMLKVHYQINPTVLQAHERSFLQEPFFQDK